MKPLLQEAGAERALTGGARGAEPRLVGGGTGEALSASGAFPTPTEPAGETSPPWGDTKGARSPPFEKHNPTKTFPLFPLCRIIKAEKSRTAAHHGEIREEPP